MPKPFFLLTGDDSVRAEGIILMKRVVEKFADFKIVATKDQQSAMGGRINRTGTWGTEIVDGAEAIWVDGSPSDAVYFAFEYLDRKPDMVLSGVNIGENVSYAIHRSGTVAAAMTACQARQTPAIAFSLVVDSDVWHKDHDGSFRKELKKYPGKLLGEIIKKAQTYDFPANTFWNVNFPPKPTKDIRIVETGEGDYWLNHQKIDADTFAYINQKQTKNWKPTTDVGALYQGSATISPCRVRYTDDSQMDDLKKLFG